MHISVGDRDQMLSNKTSTPQAQLVKKPNLNIDGKYIRQSILGFGKDPVVNS